MSALDTLRYRIGGISYPTHTYNIYLYILFREVDFLYVKKR